VVPRKPAEKAVLVTPPDTGPPLVVVLDQLHLTLAVVRSPAPVWAGRRYRLTI
jgi:hypothetical protein